ncbi:hypothetical protein [Methanosphaera sp. WGK6]|uniref:hypothetical protein n=1 Tax=Methanosphaera sp. WGK6 TaxID=1561964 RepID=UPI00084C4D5E|nr:hypothetical protein [Methanosphaera sp. WGK6]OED30859.1 hypothetical protein NL43_00680 [Methanosphaera sp. WGK6]
MFRKTTHPELLIKFTEVTNSKELDNRIYEFEKNMNEKEYSYFLKGSENPCIYFLEYQNPEELIKEIEYDRTINNNIELIPVYCVLNNINYITSTILRKIRHKITYKDTFKVNIHFDSYSALYTEEKLKKELTIYLEEIMGIYSSEYDPMWTINIYVVGDISAINIKRSKKNRNKFSHYNT